MYNKIRQDLETIFNATAREGNLDQSALTLEELLESTYDITISDSSSFVFREGISETEFPTRPSTAGNTDINFIRFNIFFDEYIQYFDNHQIIGSFICDIFLKDDNTDDIYDIVELLDVHFVNQVLANGTKTDGSTLSPRGEDPDNSILKRWRYTIPFRNYAE